MTLDASELERLYAYPASDRPWVRTNFVSTLDGAATGQDGKSGTLGGETDTRVFAALARALKRPTRSAQWTRPAASASRAA